MTNLDFVELLLGKDALLLGKDALWCITPGAANFLLNVPTTDANIITRPGASFLTDVLSIINAYSDGIARPKRNFVC